MRRAEPWQLSPRVPLLQVAVVTGLVSAPDDRSHQLHATPDPGTELQSYRVTELQSYRVTELQSYIGNMHISRQQWILVHGFGSITMFIMNHDMT